FEATEARHTQFFVRLARDAEDHLQGPSQAEWLEQLEREHDNLRAALARCLPEDGKGSPDAAGQGLALCGALWWFWYVRGHLKEGRSWLERALESSPESGEARAEALTGLGMLSQQQNDLVTAERAHREALEIRRADGSVRCVAAA